MSGDSCRPLCAARVNELLNLIDIPGRVLGLSLIGLGKTPALTHRQMVISLTGKSPGRFLVEARCAMRKYFAVDITSSLHLSHSADSVCYLINRGAIAWCE
jgi:hypothetical protein